ncbi:MAG: glutamate racemase [Candidatus Hydrogenedens sp.]|nr:glutamate racemase [Candidatus Hydrogenedens sp.]
MRDAVLPIGVFDSGVGGLTVYRAINELLPNESLIYLGDTARVPYGTKSRETVIAYARACTGVLVDQGVKLVVVACNTASAFALETLQEELPVPVIGVVRPGAFAATVRSATGRIGVIGTPATISSGAYREAIETMRPDAQVFTQACPLFVPLAEEGWTDGEVPEAVAREYLANLRAHEVDTLVLGCTHYPMLSATIAHVMGPGVCLVDSAEETARVVRDTLEAMDLVCDDTGAPHLFLASDSPENFQKVGGRFLGRDINPVQWIDLGVCPKIPS